MADVDALIGQLKEVDYYSRASAVRVLGEMGGEKAAAALIDTLNDEDYSVQEYAAEALGKLACREAVGPLGELLKSNNYKVRIVATEALGKIGGDDARALLETLKDDSDSWVRDAANNALGKISTKGPSTPSKSPAPASARGAAPEIDTEPELSISEAPAEPELRPSPPTHRLADRTPRTPEQIVELITAGTSIKYRATRSGFILHVPLEAGRYQKVRLKFDSTDDDGSPIIQVFTIIGPARSKHYRWALKLNVGFSYGGIALVKIDGKDFFAMVDTVLEESVDAKALEKSVRTLAGKGDALEKKLIRKDTW